MKDGPDLATCAQIIATLFVALAVEAQATRTRRSPWAIQKGLYGWMIVFLAISAFVLALDVAVLVGFRFFLADAGPVLPILNFATILDVTGLVLMALVGDSREQTGDG